MLEGLRIRLEDLDFARGQVLGRSGKGDKDRVTMLPVSLREGLQAPLHRVRELHHMDLAAAFLRPCSGMALNAKAVTL